MNSTYLIVDAKIVPEAYRKVVDAKAKIASGKYKSANDAIREVGISRSTFYKYKDYVFSSGELGRERLVTLEFTLDDIPGVLSAILNVLADCHLSVLTINQNIPMNDVANVTITFKSDSQDENLDELLKVLKGVKGVNKVRQVAMS